MYPFQSNYNRSTANQRLVMGYLRTVMGRTVEDLTKDWESQRNGIDFRLPDKHKTVEFKDCRQIHRTNNVCFELVSNSRKCTIGACLYSKADLLFYYDTVKCVCHVMDLPALRLEVERSPITRWNAYKINTIVQKNTILYATFGLLVPLSFIQSHRAIRYTTISLGAFSLQKEAV